MSNMLEDALTGDSIQFNDLLGKLAIGGHTFKYSDILPIVMHYVQGGLFGHSSSVIPLDELQSIRDFIKSTSELIEVKYIETGNTAFIKKSEYESCKEFITLEG